MDDYRERILNCPETGSIPDDWRLAALGDLITLQRGKDLPKSQRSAGSFPVVGSNGIVDYHSEFIAKGPGVVVGRSGSVGKVTWVEGDYWPLNTSLWIKDFHGNDPLFIYFLLNSIDLSIAAAGVSVPTLNRNLVHPLHVVVPPFSEQRAIAHVLRTVQRAKQTTEKVIAAARHLKQSLMRHLFTYGPVPFQEADQVELRETDFGAVPKVWKTGWLSDCALVQTGVAKGRKLNGAKLISVPYLRVANVQDGYLNLAEIKYIDLRNSEVPRYSLQVGDVVLTEGGDFDKLGRGFLWNGEVPGCVHQNHIFAVRANQDVLIPEFLAYLTQSAYGKAYFLSVAHKTTNLACINTTKLKAFPVLMPSKDEQQEIVQLMQQVDRKIAREEKKRSALETLFCTLLNTLMTGQARVADITVSELVEAV